jgi:hypothetical protein
MAPLGWSAIIGVERNHDVARPRVRAVSPGEADGAMSEGHPVVVGERLQWNLIGKDFVVPARMHVGRCRHTELKQQARDHSVDQLVVEEVVCHQLEEALNSKRRCHRVKRNHKVARGRFALDACLYRQGQC